MHDAHAMGGLQCAGDLDRDLQRVVDLQRATLEARGQCLAVEEFHDQEFEIVRPADVVQCADVRVRELRNDARFALESLADLRIGREPA
jgi:hypothetical protein